MILAIKVLYGSVAVATLAGSLTLADAGEAARGIAASMHWMGSAEAQRSEVQQVDMQLAEAVAHGRVQLPLAPSYCSAGCEGWGVLSKLR